MDIPTYLEHLKHTGNKRHLSTVKLQGTSLLYEGKSYENFSSNDYLGITTLGWQKEFLENLPIESFLLSNPSSRLMTGNSQHYEELEQALEAFYPGKSALVLSHGYAINSGALPALTDKKDLILCDKLMHASLMEGLKLCEATTLRFAHNDLVHLENLLKKYRGEYADVWVVTESLFSMDGDFAPIAELVELKKRYDFKLYVDEAHAFGVYGQQGEGYVGQLGLLGEVDFLLATLGKAAASCGAFLLSSKEVKEMLIQKMRPLIFSTALPPISLLWSRFVLEKLPSLGESRTRLAQYAEQIHLGLHTPSQSQIHPLLVGENTPTLLLAERFKEAGYWLTPIRHPTVPKGRARLRLSLSAGFKPSQITDFIAVCKTLFS